MERIVVAYSGGLDTSVAIRWLAEQYGAEIVAVTLDIGQGRELADIRERALALGAVRAHVIDAREEFVRDYIIPALQAGALYEDRYPLATALARPLVARGWSRSRRWSVPRRSRMAAAARATIRFGSTSRHERWSLPSRSSRRRASWDMSPAQVVDYARSRNLPVPPARRERIQHRRQSLGTLDRVRRSRGSVGRAARGHLQADARAPGRPGRTGVRRDRVRGRRSGQGQRHRDAAARADREPRHDRGIARRRADRHGREPPDRDQVARGLRGAGRHRAAHGAPRAGEARHRARSRADQARPRAHLRRPGLQRPVVLADARGHRRVRAHHPAARHRLGPAQTLQRRLPHRRPQVRRTPSTIRRSRPTTPAISSTGARQKASSRSGGFRSRPRRESRGATHAGRALTMAHLWSGRSRVIPMRSSLRSALPSASTDASSKTTCGGAWRGRRGSSVSRDAFINGDVNGFAIGGKLFVRPAPAMPCPTSAPAEAWSRAGLRADAVLDAIRRSRSTSSSIVAHGKAMNDNASIGLDSDALTSPTARIRLDLPCGSISSSRFTPAPRSPLRSTVAPCCSSKMGSARRRTSRSSSTPAASSTSSSAATSARRGRFALALRRPRPSPASTWPRASPASSGGSIALGNFYLPKATFSTSGAFTVVLGRCSAGGLAASNTLNLHYDAAILNAGLGPVASMPGRSRSMAVAAMLRQLPGLAGIRPAWAASARCLHRQLSVLLAADLQWRGLPRQLDETTGTTAAKSYRGNGARAIVGWLARKALAEWRVVIRVARRPGPPEGFPRGETLRHSYCERRPARGDNHEFSIRIARARAVHCWLQRTRL